MNTFDIVYASLVAFFFFRGWMKGFFHSLIGPICLFFWTIIGVMNYDLNDNIIGALTITFVGSVLSTVIISLILFFGKRTVSKQHRNYVFLGSRLLGGILNAGWNGLVIAFLCIFITLMPANSFGLKAAQKSIETSVSYIKFYSYLITPFPVIKNTLITISVFKHQAILDRYQNTPEYQAVFSDPKIQRLLQDPDTMSKFYGKDSIKLINDPYVRSVLQDETAI